MIRKKASGRENFWVECERPNLSDFQGYYKSSMWVKKTILVFVLFFFYIKCFKANDCYFWI